MKQKSPLSLAADHEFLLLCWSTFFRITCSGVSYNALASRIALVHLLLSH